MSVTSGNPDDLRHFVADGKHVRDETSSRQAAVTASSAVVRAASPDYHPKTDAIARCNALIETLWTNDRFVEVVHDALLDADRYNGSHVASDASIELALAARGLLDRPHAVAVAQTELYGIPPTSGFVDDPICAANGNFVHGDEDLALPGHAAALNVVRVYNSLAHRRRGSFGWGWSSLLDCRVDATEGLARIVLADGAVVALTEIEDGYAPDVRRDLTLVREDDGWTLRRGRTESWRFDAEGDLVAFTTGTSDCVVEHTPGALRIVEQMSGRWVRYETADLGVTRVETSDGRACAYGYDPDGHLTHVERVTGDITYRIAGGLVSVIEDADGVALCRNEYDADGRVVAQVSPHGRTTVYEYGELGTTRVTDAENGAVNVFVHDRRGNVTAVIDGDGNAMRLDYDAHGRVVRLIDRTGAETRYAYDTAGQLVERIDPDELAHRWTWDELGRLTEETDRAGGITRYEYEGDRRVPATVVEPDGSAVRTTYDERDLPIEVIDADGVTSRFEWDRDGQLTTIVDGLGDRTTFVHDAAGRLVRAARPDGAAAVFDLDDAGRVVESRTADDVETFAYSPAGRAVGGTNATGGRWLAEYDGSGEVARLIDPEGGVLAFARDTSGQVTAFTAPDGAIYRHSYDAVGRMVEAVDAAGNTTRLGYDAEGRSIVLVDATGREWRRAVDVFGRTTALTAPDGTTTTRAYHPNGELAKATDAEGREWSFAVDAMGCVVEATDPAGATATFEHTAAGRLRRERSPLGRVVEHRYDAAGRLESIVAPDGTVLRPTADPRGSAPAPVFDWDPRGLLARATDPAEVATEFGYDVRGRLLEQVTGAAVRRFGYDAAGRLDSVTDPLGNVTSYLLDAVGRALEVRLPGGRALRYGRDAVGAVESVTGSDGTALAEFAYDRSGLLLSAGRTTFERDMAGRIVGERGPAGTARYTRDLDGQVLSRTDEDGIVVDWLRAESGALVAFGVPGGRVEIPGERAVERDDAGRVAIDEHGRLYRYDDAGRLAEAVTADGRRTVYAYDTLGLLASQTGIDGAQRFEHDVAGRLVRRVSSDGTEVAYEYDGAGRRVSASSSDGTVVRYSWDDLDRLVRVVTTGPDTARSQDIEYDGLDRPVVVDGVPVGWDLSGRPVRIGAERYLRYGTQVRPVRSGEWSTCVPDDPWGDDGRQGVRLGYRGELALDSLVLMGARVYDSEARCFLSPDPAEPVPGALTFAGPYSYAWNDPVNFVDPSGLRPLSDAEYDAIRRQQETGTFEKAWDAIRNDPWGTLAMVGVIAVGVGLAVFAAPALAAVGVGVLIGAGTAAGLGLVTGTFNPRTVALNGVLGGIIPGGGVAAAVGTGVGVGAAYSIADQVIVQGRGLDEIDYRAVVTEATISGVSMGTARAITRRMPRKSPVIADEPPVAPSSSASNRALHTQFVEQLRVAEAANPLVGSLSVTGHLPTNYVTKSKALSAGWTQGKALGNFLPDAQIGGDIFKNPKSIGLPQMAGEVWYEADVGLNNMVSRSKQPGSRLLYSNKGRAFVTADHYENLYRLPNWQ